MEEKEEERKAELVCRGRWEVVGNGNRWRHGRWAASGAKKTTMSRGGRGKVLEGTGGYEKEDDFPIGP
jgi:hypothetical protein